MYSEEDEELEHSKYRFKDNCVNICRKDYPDSDNGYFGQGDYHTEVECKVQAMKYLNVYTARYAAFACPVYCPQYNNGHLIEAQPRKARRCPKCGRFMRKLRDEEKCVYVGDGCPN